MPLRAVLTDLGDVIMQEITEEKLDDVTQRADLFDGMADLIRQLRKQGVPLALVADTRIGTYQNVLRQHELYELFDVFAISDELNALKPDRLMFTHALEKLGVPEAEWPNVVMIGNNLARDIRGANALGLTSIWVVWNTRYPHLPADEHEEPVYQVHTTMELASLLSALAGNQPTELWRYPRPIDHL
jgi:HAD superfamily hydrolase (TIGR01549 family)